MKFSKSQEGSLMLLKKIKSMEKENEELLYEIETLKADKEQLKKSDA